MPRQLELFSPSIVPPEFESDRRLAESLPSNVLFGTASWTFPGWSGIVYPGTPTLAELREFGLELYAKHPLLSTVEIDSAYYRPLEAPTLRRYAEQLPPGFRCLSKAHNQITSREEPQKGGVNPDFLNAQLFLDSVAGPLQEHFSEHLGPLVLEFSPMRGPFRLPPDEFRDQLAEFLAALPTELQLCVELRNKELYCPEYLDVLAQHGAAHVINFWEAMPDIEEQMKSPGVLSADFVVARLLIPPGQRYASRKRQLEPFDQLVDPQDKMRQDVVALARACQRLGKVLFVIVNNKAEGCSPLTIRAIAQLLAGDVQPSGST